MRSGYTEPGHRSGREGREQGDRDRERVVGRVGSQEGKEEGKTLTKIFSGKLRTAHLLVCIELF